MTQDERIKQFDELMGDIVPSEVRASLIDRGFFHAPASTKYHGAYEGGLFDHSYRVAKILNTLTRDNELVWQNPRSPLLVGMFHDLCKIDQYRKVPVMLKDNEKIVGEIPYEYNSDTLIKGHGDKSVMLLSEYFSLTREEVLCIRYHMGAFTDKEEWRDYTRAVNNYANVLWTHHADMLASHVLGV